MPAPAFMQLASTTQAMRVAAAQPSAKDSGLSLGTAFQDLLDIVNPLQHLPVVGTLYRAITGDKIGTVEKIAGDALYGGLWGAVSSVADSAFEAVTGKDFGSTVLAFAEATFGIAGHGAPTQVAANTKIAPVAAPPPAPAAAPADVVAFGNALTAKGLDAGLSARALYAYQRRQGLTADAPVPN